MELQEEMTELKEELAPEAEAPGEVLTDEVPQGTEDSSPVNAESGERQCGQEAGTEEAAPAERNYREEAAELLERFPQARHGALPEGVVQTAIAQGIRLADAYAAHEQKGILAELETLRKENAALKQAAETAARAPVRGVTQGGATGTEPDDFLRGFDWDY